MVDACHTHADTLVAWSGMSFGMQQIRPRYHLQMLIVCPHHLPTIGQASLTSVTRGTHNSKGADLCPWPRLALAVAAGAGAEERPSFWPPGALVAAAEEAAGVPPWTQLRAPPGAACSPAAEAAEGAAAAARLLSSLRPLHLLPAHGAKVTGQTWRNVSIPTGEGIRGYQSTVKGTAQRHLCKTHFRTHMAALM